MHWSKNPIMRKKVIEAMTLKLKANASRLSSAERSKRFGYWKDKKGEETAHWKGGKTVKEGYIFVLKRNHPYANQRGYVREHRLVMEKHIGRYLKPEEVIHHLNHDTKDNRLENLQLLTGQSEHAKIDSWHLKRHSFKKGNVPWNKKTDE